jgi:Tfp pilus assembly protein PilV
MKNTRTEAGFTLVEVIIALGLLAFTLLGMFQMQLYAMRGNTLSQGSTTALHLAQDRLETLLTEPFDGAQLTDVVPGNPLESTTSVDFTQQVFDPRGNAYTLITNVNDNVGPTGTVETKTVQVNVLWGPGNIRRCAVTSLLRRTEA